MTKRKSIAVSPKLWKVHDRYLFPLTAKQIPSLEYRKLCKVYPKPRVLFLTNSTCPMQAILAEFKSPVKFKQLDSDYYIAPARKLDGAEQKIQIGKMVIVWINNMAMCLGSFICRECFIEGKLYPQTCPHHLHCSHTRTKKVRSCDACVSKTLLGYWKDRTDCYQGDSETLFSVARCNPNGHTFTCAQCKHSFTIRASGVSDGKWCRFCAHLELCDDLDCRECFAKSFASEAKSKFWCSQNDKTPRQVFRHAKLKYWFRCGACLHDFSASLNSITQGSWCPFCSVPPQRLCDNATCQSCHDKSFASHEKSQNWHQTKNQLFPRDVLRGSQKAKFWFTCPECAHDFDATVLDVVQGIWCIYCANLKLCESSTCQICFDKSFASSEKSKCWIVSKNVQTPRQTFKRTHSKIAFCCDVCGHEFQTSLENNHWCGFCTNRLLCEDDDCQTCFAKSFASHEKSKYWNFEKNDKTPRQIFKRGKPKYWFDCAICYHSFSCRLDHVISGIWCSFCCGRQRCDEKNCATCAPSCDVCKSKKARTTTHMTRTRVCRECLEDAVRRDPKEKPLLYRAKVSLEMYLLGEVLYSSDFFLSDPTSWDCPILPGLSFKPDCIWCFDDCGDVIELGSASKLNLNHIKYSLVLEILEDSRLAHSESRDISDEDREMEIRDLFASQNIPIGFLYVTVAHKKHENAHADDILCKTRKRHGVPSA